MVQIGGFVVRVPSPWLVPPSAYPHKWTNSSATCGMIAAA